MMAERRPPTAGKAAGKKAPAKKQAPATKQAAAPGVILAQAFAGRPQAQRDAFIAELSGAAGIR